MLQCRDGSLYTGITNDLDARVRRHEAGTAAKYTRSRLPVIVVYVEKITDRSSALRREHAVKKLTRLEKLTLIAHHKSALKQRRPRSEK